MFVIGISLPITVLITGKQYRVNQNTFVIMFMPQKINLFLLIAFTFTMSLVMVAILIKQWIILFAIIIFYTTTKHIIITTSLYFAA